MYPSDGRFTVSFGWPSLPYPFIGRLYFVLWMAICTVSFGWPSVLCPSDGHLYCVLQRVDYVLTNSCEHTVKERLLYQYRAFTFYIRRLCVERTS